MTLRSFALAFLVLAGPFSLADARINPRFGHNVGATGDLLASGQCTVGLQVTGCGLTRNLTLGFSSWMMVDYKIGNIAFRYLLDRDEAGNTWAVETSYFKNLITVPKVQFSKRPYEMEAVWIKWIRTLNAAPNFRTHINLHTLYWFEDEMPFSLRRPDPNRSQMQINFSILNEAELIKRWFVFLELGGLDISQSVHHFHAGASIGRTGKHYHWHLGYSMTSTLDALFAPTRRVDYQQELRETTRGYNQKMDGDKVRRDYGLHPEFSLQLFF